MKIKQLVFLLLLSTVGAIAQEFKTPVDYLNFIGREQDQISRSMWKYTTTAAHSKSVRRIETIRKQLIKNIEAASKKIANLSQGYKGDVEFRDKTLNYLSISAKNINEEYSKIIDMQEVAEKSYDDMEAYLLARDLVNNKLSDEHEKVANSQKDFAAKYNITLTESDSELSKKMKISDEVITYHTAIYLTFFKANYAENNLTAAIDERNLGKIQQSASSVLQYIDESLVKLQTAVPFKTDASFLNITKKSLEFYKKEVEVFVPKVISYLMFDDKFQNAKKVLNSKSKNDLTQIEVDNFNKMVAQFNKEVVAFNNAINANNQEKGNMLNNWNNTSDNFVATHIPEN